MTIFDFFPLGFGVWEGLQSIGNGRGLQMDEFSAHFKPDEAMCDDVHDFDDFAIVSGGLTLLPEGPRTFRECPSVAGSCENVSRRSDAVSGRSQDPLRVS